MAVGFVATVLLVVAQRAAADAFGRVRRHATGRLGVELGRVPIRLWQIPASRVATGSGSFVFLALDVLAATASGRRA